MVGEALDYNKISGLVNTSVLPRNFQSSTFGSPKYVPEDHSPFITALLGNDRIIWYEYPTPDRRQIVWAFTDHDQKHKQDKAVGLYYDTQGVLTRIIIKSGQGFSRKIAGTERESEAY